MGKLLWITLALSITACTGSTSTFSSYIPAEAAITSEAVVIPLDEISKEINYIPLETKDESLLKEVRSFIFDKNHIYINDAERQCLKFTRDGKFVCRIGSKGNGPNEYLHVTEVFLHDDKIHIYDAYSLSVLTYKLSGEFISRTALNGYLAGHMFVEMLQDGVVNKWLFFIKGKEKECEENPKFYTPIEIDSTGNLLGIMLSDNEEDNPILVIAEL